MIASWQGRCVWSAHDRSRSDDLPMTRRSEPARRRFLQGAGAAALALPRLTPPVGASTVAGGKRSLSLLHTHAGERLATTSAYRSPHTNERLRKRGGGGVARHSLHLEGRVIDVRLPGVALPTCWKRASTAPGGPCTAGVFTTRRNTCSRRRSSTPSCTGSTGRATAPGSRALRCSACCSCGTPAPSSSIKACSTGARQPPVPVLWAFSSSSGSSTTPS